jgi:hypothetical protein
MAAELPLMVIRDLHIVADHAGAASAGRHRTAVGIGERDLTTRNTRLEQAAGIARARPRKPIWSPIPTRAAPE